MPPQNDSDQCALDKNGELRDAKDIAFFHSPSDKNPISLPPVDGETVINESMYQHTAFHTTINSLLSSSSW